tara:strand:- start:186 stop:410 length:225 start_codon:yes stop_codon:yes gene_type:complete
MQDEKWDVVCNYIGQEGVKHEAHQSRSVMFLIELWVELIGELLIGVRVVSFSIVFPVIVICAAFTAFAQRRTRP